MLSAPFPRSLARTFTAFLGATALIFGTAALTPAHADSTVTPSDQKVIVKGAGWGHGKGMSQYGAYGAAKKGLSYSRILAFYYPGTALRTTSNSTMRVWLTKATQSSLYLRPDRGLQISDSAGHKVTLPRGAKYTKWRISRSSTSRTLSYRTSSGKWVKYRTKLVGTRQWWAGNSRTNAVRIAVSGTTYTYSGRVTLNRRSGRNIVVNYVKLESYLRSVVPAEMPSSWSAEALKAQAVAARTYALRMKAAATSSYDLCDTSSCQVYKDNRYRTASTDAAIARTSRKVLLYRGKFALTMFSSSNGGWSASYSGYPYLTAKKDPYDGVVRGQSWSKTVTATTLQRAYSTIGTFRSIQVTSRTGVGPYSGSGRATTVKIVGSKRSVSVSGSSFKSKLGLKETLFAFSATQVASTPTPATTATTDAALSPSDGKVVVAGAGWGHGHGMSQYGAYGAAKKGLSYARIVAFYYPGTTLKAYPNRTMRIWITGSTSTSLYFRPDTGLTVRDSAGTSVTLPQGSAYTKWRISRSSTGVRTLAYRNASGTYVTYSTKLGSTRLWYVTNPKTGTVRLAIGGSTRTYTGMLGLDVRSGKNIAINYVPLETYLRNVVPAEMPPSWSAEALKAQAIAARTFALRMMSSKSSYDLCDTSSCQVYKDNSARYSTTDAAIKATAGLTVYYGSAIALTQFSSANGGWSASASGYPYLSAHADPYDGVPRSQRWTKTITTSAIVKAYPSIGSFRSIQVTARVDAGPYSGKGRVATVTIRGSKTTVKVSGGSFKSKFGLKETLFALQTS